MKYKENLQLFDSMIKIACYKVKNPTQTLAVAQAAAAEWILENFIKEEN